MEFTAVQTAAAANSYHAQFSDNTTVEMTSTRKLAGLGVAALAVLALVVWARPDRAKNFHPLVRLPAGVSLTGAMQAGRSGPPKGWHTNSGAIAKAEMKRLPANNSTAFRVQLLAAEAREEVYDVIGKSLLRVPLTPSLNWLEPRLTESSEESGEVYLLANELLDPPEGNSNSPFGKIWLGVIYGSPVPLRHDRDRIGLIENGILKDGIIVLRLKFDPRGKASTEYLSTNQCALIRDVPGWVKIVPLDALKSYSDAGMIKLEANSGK